MDITGGCWLPAASSSLLLLAGGTVAATWAIDVYNSAPPLSSLKPVQKGRSSAIYAADGSLIGFIRASNIRQPVPRKRAAAEPQGRDGRDRGQELLQPRRARPRRRSPAPPGRTCWPAASRSRAPRRSPSSWSATSTSTTPKRRSKRKLIEAHLAYEVEEAHSKHWILTAYLNTAPYGTVEGETAVGAEAAAQTYFGKPAKELEPDRGGADRRPAAGALRIQPLPRPAGGARSAATRCWRRWRNRATSPPPNTARRPTSGLGLNPGHKYQVIRDPFLFDLVQQELIDKYGINTVRNGGLKAYTTIDPELQERAAGSGRTPAPSATRKAARRPALASVDPENGEIVALASTEGYADESQFNYAWQAHRQPGSSFKTFVLTTAIKQGIDPDTHLLRRHLAEDAGPARAAAPGPSTTPSRAAARCRSPSATWDSVNVVFAQLDLDVGPENVTQTAARNGDRSAAANRCPAEAIGGLADRRHPAGNGRRLRDPRQRRHPPRPDRDQPGRIPQRQGRRTRRRRRRTRPHRGPGLRRDQTARGRDHPGHRRRLHLRWAAPPRPARPAPPRTSPTPGSSATRRSTRPRSGSATRSRAKTTGFGGPTAGPIWRSFMEQAVDGDCPEFANPSSLPELSGLRREHTSGSSSSSGESESEFETNSNRKKKRRKGRRQGEWQRSSATAESSPAPEAPGTRSRARTDTRSLRGRRRWRRRALRVSSCSPPDQPCTLGRSDPGSSTSPAKVQAKHRGAPGATTSQYHRNEGCGDLFSRRSFMPLPTRLRRALPKRSVGIACSAIAVLAMIAAPGTASATKWTLRQLAPIRNSENEPVQIALSGISCPSESLCVAVGGREGTLAFSQNPTGGANELA